MGLLDFIKGASIDVNKVIGDLSKGVDVLAFTKEERVKFNLLLADKLAAYTESTLNESSIRSKTRRVISYIVIGAYLLLAFIAVGLSIFSPDNAEFVKNLVLSGILPTAFIMVLAFFFGGYYSEKILPKRKK